MPSATRQHDPQRFAMPSASTPLPKQTVVQLKALCNKGISKLNKAQLVKKIEVATASSSTATIATPVSHIGMKSATVPQSPDHGTPLTSCGASSYSTTTTPPTSAFNNTKSPSRQLAPSSTVVIATSSNDGPVSVTPSGVGQFANGVDHPTSQQRSKKRRTTVAPRAKSTFGEGSSPAHISAPPTRQLPSSHATAIAQLTLTSLAGPQLRQPSVTGPSGMEVPGGPDDLLRRASISEHSHSSLLHPKHGFTELLNLGPSKISNPTTQAIRKRAISTHPALPRTQASKFRPLVPVRKHVPVDPRKVVAHDEIRLLSLSSHDEGSRADRIDHVRRHFLEGVFVHLNQYRNSALAPRSIGPAPPAEGIAQLSFLGFDSRIYDLKNAAFLVALRWWVSRLYIMLQLGSGQAWSAYSGGSGLLGPDMASWPVVVDCKELTRGVYTVTTMDSIGKGPQSEEDQYPIIKEESRCIKHVDSSLTRYLTIGATGEVLASSRHIADSARAAEEVGKPRLIVDGCEVRPDWYTFLTSVGEDSCGIALEEDSTIHTAIYGKRGRKSLLSLVKTKNQHDAPSGINRSWAASMESTAVSTVEIPELLIAERAVLASCSINSYSGQKMDVAQMDAEWLSIASNGPVLPTRATKTELYLPEYQCTRVSDRRPLQVLSVHIPPHPGHPAIAIAHRGCGRSDYVLRDTGQVIGDEDYGVAELWQGILGCDAKGKEADRSGFWEDWGESVCAES